MTQAYLEDAALMECIARGDAGAFRKLSDAHLGAITTFAGRLLMDRAEAEDVAQETFLKAWNHADSYRPQAKVSTWLHTIARNLAIDRLRRRGTRGEEYVLDDERDQGAVSERPSQLLVQKQQALGLMAALNSLPERQRSAILLCHEQGFSNPEIAKVLGASVEAVESLLSRARRQLRSMMEENDSGGSVERSSR